MPSLLRRGSDETEALVEELGSNTKASRDTEQQKPNLIGICAICCNTVWLILVGALVIGLSTKLRPIPHQIDTYLPAGNNSLELLFLWYDFRPTVFKSVQFERIEDYDDTSVAKEEQPSVEISILQSSPLLDRNSRRVFDLKIPCHDLLVGSDQYWDFIITQDSLVEVSYLINFSEFESPVKLGVIIGDDNFKQFRQGRLKSFWHVNSSIGTLNKVRLYFGSTASQDLPNDIHHVYMEKNAHKVYFILYFAHREHNRVSVCDVNFAMNLTNYAPLQIKSTCILTDDKCVVHGRDIVMIRAGLSSVKDTVSKLQLIYTYLLRYEFILPGLIIPTFIVLCVDIGLVAIWIVQKMNSKHRDLQEHILIN